MVDFYYANKPDSVARDLSMLPQYNNLPALRKAEFVVFSALNETFTATLTLRFNSDHY